MVVTIDLNRGRIDSAMSGVSTSVDFCYPLEILGLVQTVIDAFIAPIMFFASIGRAQIHALDATDIFGVVSHKHVAIIKLFFYLKLHFK